MSATRRAPVGVTSPSDIHLTVTITFGQALAWGSESLAGFTSFDLWVLGGNARMPVSLSAPGLAPEKCAGTVGPDPSPRTLTRCPFDRAARARGVAGVSPGRGARRVGVQSWLRQGQGDAGGGQMGSLLGPPSCPELCREVQGREGPGGVGVGPG